MKTALTIAGSDSSGGAGIQADLKTMTMHHVYGMSAITALTAQNTTGVRGVLEVPPEVLAQQLDAVFSDIFPDGVKIGMVPSACLMQTQAAMTLKEKLLPLATLAPPNPPWYELRPVDIGHAFDWATKRFTGLSEREELQ